MTTNLSRTSTSPAQRVAIVPDMFLDGESDEQVAALAAAPPLERLGTPEDIAAAVALLAGPDGR